MLAHLVAARIPARAADHCHRSLAITGNRLEAAWLGKGVVQGQDGDAAGGIGEGGITQLPAGPTHGVGSAAGVRWRWRKLAALLRPQPAASARVRAVQACPSGRGCA